MQRRIYVSGICNAYLISYHYNDRLIVYIYIAFRDFVLRCYPAILLIKNKYRACFRISNYISFKRVLRAIEMVFCSIRKHQTLD